MISSGMTRALIFEKAVAVILKWEGGGRFHWDHADPGGATKYGISLRFAGSVGLDVDGDGKTTKGDIEALTRREAVELYRNHFWKPLQCEDMGHPGLALMVFDCGVNQGVKAAAMILQDSVGATADGVVGPKTIEAVKLWGSKKAYPNLIDEVAARRAKRYAGTRNFKRFGMGWMRRLMDVHRIALEPWRP